MEARELRIGKMMDIKVGDKIEIEGLGGPYTVIDIKDKLIIYKLDKNRGTGMTIKKFITKVIK
jgi:hypothetical protein